jgi:hypothetical protein
MATADQVAEVRENTSEPTPDPFTDAEIGALIDTLASVNLASSVIWSRKAAGYAELVDTAEAGASRKLSDLYDRAILEANRWKAKEDELLPEADIKGRATVHVIQRTQ